jgi:FSR family fosmidomycin resistance protein-like MFS transporter
MLSVSASVFGHFIVEMCYNFLPIVYPLLIASMGLRFSQIGFIAFVLSIVTSVAQPAFGLLSDRWSPWKLASLGVIWGGIFLGLIGLAPSYELLVLVVALGALGSAAFHPSGATIASVDLGKHRGAVVSLFSVGGNLGAATSPLLVAASIGWLGLSGTSILIPIAILAGLLMYWQLGIGAGIRSEDYSQTKINDTSRANSNGWKLGLILVVLSIMFRSWFLSFITYLPMWIQEQGRTLEMGGQLLFVFSAFLAGGSLFGGVLSDRIGRWQVLALGLGLLGPAYWFFLNAVNSDMHVILLSVMGILVGLTFPVSIVFAQEMWPRGVGLASALVIGLASTPAGIGASVTGILADKYSLEVGLRALLFAPICGLACVLILVVLQHRNTMPHRP